LRMPNLKGLADRGTRFTNAYTPAPWCASARACLASGMTWDSSPKTLNGQDFPTEVPTWYEALRKVGYHTIAVGKDDLCQSMRGVHRDGSRHAEALGLDDWFRMQDKYVTYRRHKPWDQFGMSMWTKPCGLMDSGELTLYAGNFWCYGRFGRGKCCERIAHEGFDCPGLDQVGANQEDYIDNFVAFQAEMLLDRAPPGKPWVLHLSFPGPHPPFVITESMNRSIADRKFKPSKDNRRLSGAQQSQIRQQYAAQIENLDSLFGRLLAKLEASGHASNTLVVVASDHGEQLGDQNAWGKKQPWEPSLRVPLVISGPGVAKGRTVEVPVSTLDIVGTFLDRAGTKLDKQDATSLEPLLRAEKPPDEVAYLKERPFVPSGLTYPGGKGDDPPVDFRAAIRRLNETHTLKVVCCPKGCPLGNSAVPTLAPNPQLLAFNVADGAAMDVVNLNHTPEARQLARSLPGLYATACLPLAPSPSEGLLHGSGATASRVEGASGPDKVAIAVAAAAAAVVLAVACCRKRRGTPVYKMMGCDDPSDSEEESDDEGLSS